MSIKALQAGLQQAAVSSHDAARGQPGAAAEVRRALARLAALVDDAGPCAREGPLTTVALDEARQVVEATDRIAAMTAPEDAHHRHAVTLRASEHALNRAIAAIAAARSAIPAEDRSRRIAAMDVIAKALEDLRSALPGLAGGNAVYAMPRAFDMRARIADVIADLEIVVTEGSSPAALDPRPAVDLDPTASAEIRAATAAIEDAIRSAEALGVAVHSWKTATDMLARTVIATGLDLDRTEEERCAYGG